MKNLTKEFYNQIISELEHMLYIELNAYNLDSDKSSDTVIRTLKTVINRINNAYIDNYHTQVEAELKAAEAEVAKKRLLNYIYGSCQPDAQREILLKVLSYIPDEYTVKVFIKVPSKFIGCAARKASILDHNVLLLPVIKVTYIQDKKEAHILVGESEVTQ